MRLRAEIVQLVSVRYPGKRGSRHPHSQQRIKNLRELAKKAPTTTDPGQRESICQELAQEIRKEPDSIMRGEILRTLAAYGGPTADAVLRRGREGYRCRSAGYRLRSVGQAERRRGRARCSQACLPATATATSAWRPPAALGHSHDPAAVRALGTALDDTDPAMRYRVMRALRESTGKDIGTDPSDVDRWRQYVKTGQVPPKSWAERLFPWYH